jgi:hypothetical protein
MSAGCATCGVTETTTTSYRDGQFVKRTVPVAEVCDVPMCWSCYYSGRGFSRLYQPVIDLCKGQGVDLSVWHTGGGCQNLAVLFPSEHRDPENDDDVREMLFGLLHGDLATDELGIDLYTHYDYHDEWSYNLNDQFPAPEVRTWESVASWIVDVVRRVESVHRAEIWQSVCREISRCYPNSYGHQGTIYIDASDRHVVMVDQDSGDCRIGVYLVVDNEVAEDPSEFHELDLLDHTADSIMGRLHDIFDSLTAAPLDDDGNCTRCGAPQRGCDGCPTTGEDW